MAFSLADELDPMADLDLNSRGVGMGMGIDPGASGFGMSLADELDGPGPDDLGVGGIGMGKSGQGTQAGACVVPLRCGVDQYEK